MKLKLILICAPVALSLDLFTCETGIILREWFSQHSSFEISKAGIQTMLKRLGKATGIPCSAHNFRRGFACNLHRKGPSTLDIMHLGGWSDLSMVLRYTRSITFDDCINHYRRATD